MTVPPHVYEPSTPRRAGSVITGPPSPIGFTKWHENYRSGLTKRWKKRKKKKESDKVKTEKERERMMMVKCMQCSARGRGTNAIRNNKKKTQAV